LKLGVDQPVCVLRRSACAQDKVGPFCRAAADCAAIYDVIRGRDAADPGSRDAALPDPATLNVSGLVVGMLPSAQPYAGEVRPAESVECACLSLTPAEQMTFFAWSANVPYLKQTVL